MNATIQHHLKTYGEDNCVAVQLQSSLYSDNLVSGVETEEDGSHFYIQSKDIFNSAGMNLLG